MVEKMRLVAMLNDALVFEEISILPLLDTLLGKLSESRIDDAVKREVGERIRVLHQDTVQHSMALSKMVRRVVESGKDEY